MPRIENRLNFVVLITFDKVRRWSREVRTMGRSFAIRRKKGSMEHGMEARAPGRRKDKMEGDIIDSRGNGKRAIATWSELQRGSEGGDMLAFQPDLITDLIRNRRLRGRPGLVDKGLGSEDIGSKRR